MSFSLSTLGAYTKDNVEQLLTRAVAGSVTAKYIMDKGTVMASIKTAERINLMNTDAVFQAGGCGFNASGTTTYTQRTLTVGSIKVQESLCPTDLEAKYTQLALKAGSNYDSIIFEQEYTDLKNQIINYQNEVAIWSGDTTSGTGNLNKFDGFIKLIDAEAGKVALNAEVQAGTITSSLASATVTGVSTLFTTFVNVGDKIYSGGSLIGTVLTVGSATSITLTGNASTAVAGASFKVVPVAASNTAYFTTPLTAITSSNVIALFDNMYAAIPEAVLMAADQPVIFCGLDVARTYKLALKAANMFHYAADMEAQQAFMIPGLGIMCVPIPGLTSTNRIYAMQPGNMVLGTDLLGEGNKYKMYYNEHDDLVRYDVRYKLGVQVAFPDQIVAFAINN